MTMYAPLPMPVWKDSLVYTQRQCANPHLQCHESCRAPEDSCRGDTISDRRLEHNCDDAHNRVNWSLPMIPRSGSLTTPNIGTTSWYSSWLMNSAIYRT